MFSSAAAGVSLIAAALVLVIGVSALIGFRGFKSARQETAVQQRVVLPSTTPERETGGTAPVVIGGERRRTTRKRPTAPRPRRTSVKSRPARVKKRRARSGLSAPARRKASAPAGQPPAQQPQQEQPTAPSPAPTAAPPADPIGEVLDNVTGAVESGKPVESVGDILLDLRDILP